MPVYFWFWVFWLIAGTGYEVWAVWFHPAPRDTLSEFTVYAFHTRTKIGWTLFLAFIAGLAAWYPAHIRNLSGRNKKVNP